MTNNIKIELDSKAQKELGKLFPSTSSPILYNKNGDVWGSWSPNTNTTIPMYINYFSTQHTITIDCAKLLKVIENSYCAYNLDSLTQYKRYNNETSALKNITDAGVIIWSVCINYRETQGSLSFVATKNGGIKFGIFNNNTEIVEPLTFNGYTLRDVLTSHSTLSLTINKNLGLHIWQTFDNSNILLSDSADELIASDCYVAIKDTNQPITE